MSACNNSSCKHATSGVLATVGLLLVLASFFVGIFVYQHWQQAQSRGAFSGTYLQEARDLPSFELQSTQGQILNPTSIKGHWTWLFFGFTQCPSICPTTLAKLSQAYQILQTEHAEYLSLQNLPHIIMVSLDPKRDDLEHLKKYMHGFNPDFYGARGSSKDIKVLTKFLGVAYVKSVPQSGKNENNYSIEHSGALMIINPQGQLQAYINPPFSVEQLVQDHLILVRK